VSAIIISVALAHEGARTRIEGILNQKPQAKDNYLRAFSI